MEISEEELNSRIKAATDSVSAKFTGDIDSLNNKNKELLNEKKNLQQAMAKFEGFDIEEHKRLMEVIGKSEEAKLIAEGKVDEVISKRTEKYRLDMDQKLEELQKERDSLAENYSSLSTASKRKDISVTMTQEATKAGVAPTAVSDIIDRALKVFTVDDDGTVIARNSDGEIITKGGKPLTPEVFMSDLKKSAPHFWPSSVSGNLSGEQETEASEAAKTGDMAAYRASRKKA